MAYCEVTKRECAFLGADIEGSDKTDNEMNVLESMCVNGLKLATDAEFVSCGLETTYRHEEEYIVMHGEGQELPDAT